MRDTVRSGRVCANTRIFRCGASSVWLLLGLIVPLAEPLTTRVLPLSKKLHASPHAAAAAHRLVLRRGAVRWQRGIVACVEVEEMEEEDPDADLASAWLDEKDAGVLQGESVDVEAADAFEHARSGAATLVDLRTPEQFANGHAPGSVNIPAGEPGPSGLLFHFRQSFESDLRQRYASDARLLLMCEVGVVSRVAAERLVALGMSAASVRGGYEAWCMEETLPVEADPDAPALAQTAGAPLVDGQLPEGWSSEDAAGLPAPGEGFVAWSAWDDDRVIWEPVIDTGLSPDETEDDLDALIREEEEDEPLDDLMQEAPAAYRPRPSAPPPPPAAAAFGEAEDSTDGAGLDLDELTKLLGDGQSKELPYFTNPPSPSRGEADPGGRVAAPVGGGAPPAPPSYYAASTTSYGGPSRALKGVKTRRTRGGLPPAWLVDVPQESVHAAAAAGTLDSLSVKELKSFLYYRDAPLSGPKKELIGRIGEVLQREERDEISRGLRREERGDDDAGEGGSRPPYGLAGGTTAYLDPPGDGAASGEDRLIDEVFAEM